MRTLTAAVILLAVTATGVAFHRPTSGAASGARPSAAPAPADVAITLLAKGDALAETSPRHAAAFYRACLALEGAAGDPVTFRAARERLAALETPKPITPAPTVAATRLQPRKGTVTGLAAKIEPSPEPLPVMTAAAPARAISVGPDGVVYDEQP